MFLYRHPLLFSGSFLEGKLAKFEAVNIHLSATKNLHSSATENIHPTTTTNLHSSATENIHSSATENLHFSAIENLHSSATENIHSSATENLHSSATENLHSSATENIHSSATENLHLHPVNLKCLDRFQNGICQTKTGTTTHVSVYRQNRDKNIRKIYQQTFNFRGTAHKFARCRSFKFLCFGKLETTIIGNSN
jgi:hypothetical protein